MKDGRHRSGGQPEVARLGGGEMDLVVVKNDFTGRVEYEGAIKPLIAFADDRADRDQATQSFCGRGHMLQEFGTMGFRVLPQRRVIGDARCIGKFREQHDVRLARLEGRELRTHPRQAGWSGGRVGGVVGLEDDKFHGDTGVDER